MFLALAAAAVVFVLLAGRYWNQLNSTDLGSMSTQWLAEYNAHHQ